MRVLPTVCELHLDPEAVEALVRAIAPSSSAASPARWLGIESRRVHAGDDGFAFTGAVSVLTGAVETSAGPGCPAVLR